MSTNICKSYVDFLNVSSRQYSAMYERTYTNDVCVYALSAKRSATDSSKIDADVLDDITGSRYKNVDYQHPWPISWGINMNFAKASSEEFLCYKFKLSDVTTESDTEPDVPYSYEELFNENVLKNMYSSTGMQYKYIYSAYNNAQGSYIPGMGYPQQVLVNNFKTTNNLVSDKDFVRSDYYKFFVPETDVVHSRSMLELTDDIHASVGNFLHESFNCLLFCINPNFDSKVSEGSNNGVPKGFYDTNFEVVPISVCTYSKDIILAGNNLQFEPNLNGIVTVE